MLSGFKQFIMRGNVVDLAVGVVMGAAFGKVVDSLVKSFISPLIALVAGKPDYSSVGFELNGVKFPLGNIISDTIMFLLTAAAVYFFVVLPINTLTARMKRGEVPPDPTTKKCPECLSEIPIGAHKCAHCTSVVA